MTRPARPTGRFAIAPTLVVAVGTLVSVSVGSILALQYYASTQIVSTLGSGLVARNLQILERALSRHLGAAVTQGIYIEKALRDGAYEIGGKGAFSHFLSGALAAAPQVNGIIVARPDNHAARAIRALPGSLPVRDWIDFSTDAPAMEIAAEIKTHPTPNWGAPVYAARMGQTVLNYRVPLWTDGAYDGFIAIGVGTKGLSDLTEELSKSPNTNVFVIYGADHVLAAPGSSPPASRDTPMVPIREAGNAVLSALSGAVPFTQGGLIAPAGARISQVTANEENYVVITKEITGYGATPLTIGAYSPLRTVDGPLRLLSQSLAAGLALLLISVALAVALSRLISRPIRRTAEEAAKIATLEFDEVNPVTGSILREIDDLAFNFNTMLEGVKNFGRYVPRKLVGRLIHDGRIGDGSEERDLTVMFTDIAGFTATCEGLSPNDVAAFINHHLTLVAACIDREGGTIDKYIGDAVMAFWGAPDRIDDAPARACRAALAIGRAIQADNAARLAQGKSPVRIRIGLHRGPLIVGDIGAPERINYTVVGDVVNAAQRLESLGKEIDRDAEVIVLASAETIRDSGLQSLAAHQGAYTVKGKERPIDVYRLA